MNKSYIFKSIESTTNNSLSLNWMYPRDIKIVLIQFFLLYNWLHNSEVTIYRQKQCKHQRLVGITEYRGLRSWNSNYEIMLHLQQRCQVVQNIHKENSQIFFYSILTIYYTYSVKAINSIFPNSKISILKSYNYYLKIILFW